MTHAETIEYLKKYPQVGILYLAHPHPKNVTICIDLAMVKDVPEFTPEEIVQRWANTGELLYTKKGNDVLSMFPYNP